MPQRLPPSYPAAATGGAPLRTLLGLAAVPIWLAASIPLAILTLIVPLPNLVGNFIFFAPQYLFEFVRVVRPEGGYGFDHLFPDGTAGFACAVLWLTVAIGHAAITRRWKLSHAFAAGLVVVVAATVLAHLTFAAFGYAVQLDGP